MPARLAAFLNARWEEEERDSQIFHELDCPAATRPTRGPGRARPCGCPVPALIRRRIAAHRRILRDCEQRIQEEQESGLCWPRRSTFAFQTMKALALPYELHPAWQDIWYP
ncbi:DUF6221 family protein [Streptomyces sp. NPDC101225]|uniref:DUF6221 family protein n=1 Tax=Streptomyces sp. NPDC101225 TaxID=3366135 RepID=UPI003817F11F